jgi:hypothetical protein
MTDLLSDLGEFPPSSAIPFAIAGEPGSARLSTAVRDGPDAPIAAVGRLAKLDQNLSGKSPAEIRRALDSAWALALSLRSDEAVEVAARLEPSLNDLEEPAARTTVARRLDSHPTNAFRVTRSGDLAALRQSAPWGSRRRVGRRPPMPPSRDQ